MHDVPELREIPLKLYSWGEIDPDNSGPERTAAQIEAIGETTFASKLFQEIPSLRRILVGFNKGQILAWDIVEDGGMREMVAAWDL